MRKWGTKEILERLYEYQRRSGKVPRPFRERVELTDENFQYWAAYMDLRRSGTLSSYAEIRAYAELAGVNGAELLVKLHVIEDALNDIDS